MDLSARIAQITRSYRLGTNAEAHEQLVALIDALAMALGRPPLAARAGAIMAMLEDVLEAQQRVDTLCIADLLQYRLVPLLEGA